MHASLAAIRRGARIFASGRLRAGRRTRDRRYASGNRAAQGSSGTRSPLHT
jgi:ribosomal protein S3